MNKKIRKLALALMLLAGMAYVTGSGGQQTVYAEDWKNTINIKSPVKSSDELVETIANSLDSVCETLNLTINNTERWFNFKDRELLSEYIDKAVAKSLIGGPYYNGCSYTENTGILYSSIKVSIKFDYKFSRKNLLAYLDAVATKITEVVESVITPDMDDYQKEKALHDYIVKHASFDYKNFQNGTIPNESYTPYGVLILGAGVCEGYAQAMQLLSNKAGLACMVVTGAGDGQPHTWNIIKIGEEYYHVDVTWDDPVKADLLSYNYFNLSDDMISVNHSWDKNSYPQCKALTFNYFNINGLLVANMDECRQRIRDAVAGKQKKINLKVLDFDQLTFQKDIKSFLSKLPFRVGYTYTCYEELGVVEIEIRN